MITTEKFAFIHMHKTGGQSINNIIENCVPSFKAIGYHYPHFMLPEACADLPIVGMVRNPWDWYVSWYAFNIRLNGATPLFYFLSDGLQADFKTTLINLIQLGANTPKSQNYRNALIEVLPDSLEGNEAVGLTGDCIRHFIDDDHGYYSWQFKRMHGDLDNNQLYIGRFENLEHDFLAIMEQLQIEEAAAMRSKFESSAHLNKSRHSHYSAYYDDELRDLVAEKESLLIEKYGYQFESVNSDQKTIAFPSVQVGGIEDGFQKLSGKAGNYLLLDSDIDIEPIKEKLAQVTQAEWDASGREKTFEAHRQTKSLMLIYDEDFRHYKPTYQSMYARFDAVLKPLLKTIANHFEHNGFVVRVIFAKLQGHGKIPVHTDSGYSLLKCHRIHIPIVSNDQSFFTVGGEKKVMREGEMWEINNATLHQVENQSDEDRIHLIIDWVPNSTVRPEHKAPPPQMNPAKPRLVVDPNQPKVGRNDPCPCQSGKKFKKCHGLQQ